MNLILLHFISSIFKNEIDMLWYIDRYIHTLKITIEIKIFSNQLLLRMVQNYFDHLAFHFEVPALVDRAC